MPRSSGNTKPQATKKRPNANVVASENSHESVVDLISEGNELSDVADFNGALEKFQAAMDVEPNNPSAVYGVALCHGELGDNETALPLYRKAATLDPKNYFFHSGVAICLDCLEREEEALEEIKKSIQLFSDDDEISNDEDELSELFATQMSILYSLERYQEVIDLADEELLENTTNADCYSYIGLSHEALWQETGDDTYGNQVIPNLELAVEYDPKFCHEVRLAALYGGHDQPLDAMLKFQKAIQEYEHTENEGELRAVFIKFLFNNEEVDFSLYWETPQDVKALLSSNLARLIELDNREWQLGVLNNDDISAEALAEYPGWDLEGVKKIYSQAIAEEPENTATLNVDLSYTLIDRGEYEDALEAADAAIEADEDLASAHGARGASLAFLERYDEAIVSQRKAVELEPDSMFYVKDISNTLQSQDKMQEAADYLKEILESSPEEEDLWVDLGQIYEELNQYENKLEVYRKLLEMSTTEEDIKENRINMIEGLTDTDQYDEADEIIQSMLEDDSEDVDVLMMQGYFYDEQRKFTLSIEVYNKVLEMDDCDVTALQMKAYALEFSGNREEALNLHKKRLEVDEEDDVAASDCAYVLNRLEKYDEAIEFADKSLAIVETPNAYTHKAHSNWKQGNVDEAMSLLAKAEEMETPLNPYSFLHFTKAQILNEAKDDLEEAGKEMTRCLEILDKEDRDDPISDMMRAYAVKLEG